MSSNRTSQTARVTKLIAGSTKHLSNLPSVTFGGASYTFSALMQELQSILTVDTDVDTARAALKAKLLVDRDQAPASHAFLSAFMAFVRSYFGNAPDILADFGLPPRKVRTPRKVEAKVQTVEKALATRAARHTLGKKQKAKIHGVVPEPATSGTPATPEVAPMPPSPGGAAPAKQ